MSPATQSPLSLPPARAENPYPIGFREVPVRQADGTIDFVREPLTLEQALHPQIGDVMSESSLHAFMIKYLQYVFDVRAAKIPGMLVLADVGIYWDKPELKHHFPDISVIPNVRDRETWTKESFQVAEEKTRPCLIVELVTPSTRVNDVDRKFEAYYAAQVPYYVILDRETEDSPWVLLGYERGKKAYRPMRLDAQGRLWLPPLGIWLGVDGRRVVCFDDQGKEIEDYVAMEARAAQAEARIRELEAKLAARDKD